jgi:gluconate 5-dehydrogenase
LVLAKKGAKVVGIARNEEMLLNWKREGGENCDYLVCDLAQELQNEALMKKIEAIHGAPDILINAAGINTREHANDVTLQNWDRTLQLNLSTPFFLAQAMVPKMIQRNWGRVINFASLQSRRAFPSGISYGASKGGLEQLTRAMAEAWSKEGIMVNSIAPGFFPTALTESVFNDESLSEKNAKQTCIGRNGRLSDLDGPLLFLCSSASDYVTGQMLFVDGGFTSK